MICFPERNWVMEESWPQHSAFVSRGSELAVTCWPYTGICDFSGPRGSDETFCCGKAYLFTHLFILRSTSVLDAM